MFRRRRLLTVADLERQQRIGWVFTVVIGTLIGLIHLCLLGVALADGSIGAPNKMRVVSLSRDADPFWYWFYFTWWALFGAAAFTVAYRAFLKIRNANAVR